MVIHVYVEGGVINGNVDATTASNSEALREELNRFMQKALGREDITIVVKKCAGYKNAVKEFINSDAIHSTYLYVDLDRVPELREDWFNSLVDDNISVPEERKSRICFWIQEMEAWFLKQPLIWTLGWQNCQKAISVEYNSSHTIPVHEYKESSCVHSA